MNETKNLESTDLWNRAKAIFFSTLHTQDEKNQAERYFSMINGIQRKENTLEVSTETSFAAELLQKEYVDKIRGSLTLAGDKDNLSVTFKWNGIASKPAAIVPQIESEKVINNLPQVRGGEALENFNSPLPLNPSYTFSEFVCGPSNSWAFAAARGVVTNPGMPDYNPLFIHGGTGLGKTHLMHAIGNAIKNNNPKASICYITAEVFLNEYLNYLNNGKIESFRHRYRNVDLLLIDDVQFLQKKNQFQEEFFNTFNALQFAQKQIVMTSDVAPQKLPAIEQRLISRFEGGMVQEIESPNYETRLAILKKKSENITPHVPQNALEFIADTIKSHVRAMEGALRKIHLYLMVNPTVQFNEELLRYLLKDFIEKEHKMRTMTIEEIQNSVAKKFGVKVEQLLSAERTQILVTPRQLSMYIARKFTSKSLPEISKKFEKSHATIIHGVKTIEKRLDVEPELKSTLSDILADFGYTMNDKMDD